MKPNTWIVLFLSPLVLSSCTVHQIQREIPTPFQTPDSFSRSGDVSFSDSHWWEAFQSIELNRLVQELLSENLDIQTAWARIDQMAALAQQTGSSLFPQVTFDGRMSRAKSEMSFLGNSQTNYSSQIPINLNLSYEIDLWDRMQSQREAAWLDTQAQAETLQTTLLVLTSQLVTFWITSVGAEAERALLEEQNKTNQTYLDLVELRFSQGMVSAVDVYQQRQQLAATRAEIPLVESTRDLAIEELAVLVTQAPKATFLHPSPQLPELPPLPALGFPSDLIVNRPDIRAAYLRILSADFRLASAIADQYPTIRFLGSSGVSGEEVSDLFDNWIGSLAASLSAPILDGNRRKAVVEQNRAKVQELILTYGKTILTAFKEVEAALVKEEKQKEYLDQLATQWDIAQSELREARSRYMNGLSDFLPVLRALQSLQNVERRHLAGRRNLLFNRIQLYSALGGQWTGHVHRSNQEPTSLSSDKGVSK